MKEGLGEGACSLVRINSGEKDRKSGIAGLWKAHIRCLARMLSAIPGSMSLHMDTNYLICLIMRDTVRLLKTFIRASRCSMWLPGLYHAITHEPDCAAFSSSCSLAVATSSTCVDGDIIYPSPAECIRIPDSISTARAEHGASFSEARMTE